MYIPRARSSPARAVCCAWFFWLWVLPFSSENEATPKNTPAEIEATPRYIFTVLEDMPSPRKREREPDDDVLKEPTAAKQAKTGHPGEFLLL